MIIKRNCFDPAVLQYKQRNGLIPGMAPRIVSRRFAMTGEGKGTDGTAYKSDGPDPDPERAALLDAIRTQTLAELKERNYVNTEDVKKAMEAEFENRLKGISLDALRAYEKDVEKRDNTILSLSLELEKMKKVGSQAKEIRNGLEHMFKQEGTIDQIRKIFEDEQNGREVVINIRALNKVMTTGNTVDSSAITPEMFNSFSVGEYVKKRQPVEWVFNIASRRTVASIEKNHMWLEEGNVDGGFALVLEGQVKPYVSGGTVWNTTEANKLAAKYVITEELEKFMQNILNIIEDLIRDKLLRDYNDEIAIALLADAASYVGTPLDGKYSDPTFYHVLGAVAAQMQSLNFNPSVLIIHPVTKWEILLEQASDGHFFVQIPQIDPITGQNILVGLRVVTSTKIPEGTGVMGEEGLWKVEDESITVRVGYGIEVTKDGNNVTDVSSDWDNNRKRMIVETWYRSWIPTPFVGSFVEFDFEDVRIALTTP